MTIDEFIERYNQEIEWCNELFTPEFMDSHPFIKSKYGDRMRGEKLDKQFYAINSTVIYDGVDTNGQTYYELQAYSYITYGMVYFWIHPYFNEQEYKTDKLNSLKKVTEILNGELIQQKAELEKMITEVNDLFNIIHEREIK